VVFKDLASAPGNEMIRLYRASVRPLHGSAADPITVRTPFIVEFEYWKRNAEESLELGVHVNNEGGTLLFQTWWPSNRPVSSGFQRSWFVVPGDLLNTGTHRIDFSIEVAGGCAEFILTDLLVFEVLDAGDLREMYHGDWAGAVRPNLPWTTVQIDAPTGVVAWSDPHT
jgi:lipopolysaccharide transport system ATP-binding protein